MSPTHPKRHTQADIDTAQGRDLTHHVTRWGKPPLGQPTWLVTCRRRLGGGTVTVEVQADTAQAAKQRVAEGNVPGIGLGWRPQTAVLKS